MTKSLYAGTALFLGLITSTAQAQEADLDALQLADTVTVSPERAGDLTAFVETALGSTRQRYDAPDLNSRRLSFDVQYDKTLSKAWRVVLSDRLDTNGGNQSGQMSTVNTLREAYASWQPSEDHILDVGRINMRNGVAIGYNPTDYFRAGALRSVSSIDPASLKRNRLGSVMLRGQTLWDSGSLTALVSPKLESQPNDAPFNADLGATNHANRWLLSLGIRISDGFNPQWILFGEDHREPQMGINATRLLNDATVAYAEWSGGRSQSLRAETFEGTDDKAFRSHLATGLTYTTENKMSYTLEYEYSGIGMSSSDWDALRKGSPLTYLRYRTSAQSLQEPVTKEALFFYSTWQDALINHLDLTAMMRYNAVDHSKMLWLEARHHWDHADFALQWQINSGGTLSEFGALQQRRAIQFVGTYYFH
jgi:hypothetical protein